MKGRAPELEGLVGRWLDAHAAGRAKETLDMIEMHMAVHLVPFFGRLERMTEQGARDYIAHRLAHVKASTVRKELSSLRQFLAWAFDERVLPERVFVPAPPKRAVGTPVERVRQVQVPLTRYQADAFIEALPELGRGGFPTRTYVEVMALTGMRRATLWRLEAPENYYRGAPDLRITPRTNKARLNTVLPLSQRVRELLDSVCPDEGPIFGRRDVREAMRAASMDIGLPPHLAGRVSSHDLRRHFATRAVEDGVPLNDLQTLLLHKHLATTALYPKGSLEGARKALETMEAARNGSRNGTRRGPKVAKSREGKRRNARKIKVVRGGGVEPPRS